jgi:hypothetical protein
VVQKPTGRRNHYVGLLSKSNGLLYHVQTTQYQSASERNQRAERLESLRNLRRQFSRGRQHQGEQGLRFVEQGLENGKGKGSRLSATRFRDTDNVTILEGQWD